MRARTALIVLVLGAELAGCMTTRPSRFYTLTPASVAAAPAETAGKPGRAAPLGLGPLDLPPYLDRPEIVTRQGEYQVKMAEFDGCAEPLQAMLSSVFADRVGKALQGRRDVVEQPAHGGVEPYFGVSVSI